MGEMGEREQREKREILEYCQLEELSTFAGETDQGVEMKMAKILHGFAYFLCIGGEFGCV